VITRPIVELALRWSLRRPRVVTHAGLPYLVLPGVLDPVMSKVGAWLADVLSTEARPGETWLDLGCGSGIVAIALAKAGARVTAVDIDAEAVRCTRLNAAMHHVEVDARQGDRFAGLGRYDRVACNPPFWPGDGAGRPLGHAMYAGRDFAWIRGMIAELPGHCEEARVVLSERGGDFTGAREALGPASSLLRRTRHRGEWLDLFRVGPW
jgi:release factor glutamine methyltransferase